MYSIAVTILIVRLFTSCLAETSDPEECNIVCPPEDTQCAFDIKKQTYKLFSSKCAMAAYSKCHGIDFVQTPLKYCIKNQRRFQQDSCPVFCPNYYSPVCGASKYRSYNYRSFNNGCYLDMINCRGDEDTSTYIEVPLQFCQNHAMKNIFKEQVVVSNLHDYEDYAITQSLVALAPRWYCKTSGEVCAMGAGISKQIFLNHRAITYQVKRKPQKEVLNGNGKNVLRELQNTSFPLNSVPATT